MSTIDVSDSELTLLRNALRSYLAAFGHNEADLLRETKQLLAKLTAADPT